MLLHAPKMLILLVVLPVLGKILLRAQRLQSEAAEKLQGKGTRSPKKSSRRRILSVSALGALIIALAQPAWNPRPGPLQVQGRDLVIALDISRSMLATDVFPSRLDAAKISIYENLDLLQGQKIGLITFAGAASIRVPLTLDHNFVRYMMERAQPSDADIGSTSLQSAIEKAIDIALSESKQGKQDILLFTDGEDHISDIETTAAELRECGARVLIIGLGDPVAGAKVPAMETTNSWMQYKGKDVITKLDEEKLIQLSSQSPNVIYHAARTRPFDLISLYRRLIADTSGLPVSDKTQLVYTEGYPLFIALALILWLIPLNKRLFPSLILCLFVGCGKEVQVESRHVETGRALWSEAQQTVESDPETALFTLMEARRELLQAAMMQPGDPDTARQIAGISLQIRTVKKAVQEQEAAEKDLQQKMQEAIEQLHLLTNRENTLARQSQQLLRRRPAVPEKERAAAVKPARLEQTEVRAGTETVTKTVAEVQSVIRKMLSAAYGDEGQPPPTEFDEALDKLVQARSNQIDALQKLAQETVAWPQVNSAFHGATRQMQEALRLLSDQNPGEGEDKNSEMSDEGEMDWEFDEDMEWSESDMPSDLSMPMQSGNFQTALENRSLPTPNYTAEEILMEEAANMEQRAQQQSGRAGAKVEKNW